MNPTFRFIEFNPRRAQRGAAAARVEVIYGETSTWLWMRPEDIMNNLETFGDSAELNKALGAYQQRAPVR